MDDWQQGTKTNIAGLDPLWILNHLHFMIQAETKKKGLLSFHGGGLGNHRYRLVFQEIQLLHGIHCLSAILYFNGFKRGIWMVEPRHGSHMGGWETGSCIPGGYSLVFSAP